MAVDTTPAPAAEGSTAPSSSNDSARVASPTTLNDREINIITAMLRALAGSPQVDFPKLAELLNMTNNASARNAVNRILKRLDGPVNNAVSPLPAEGQPKTPRAAKTPKDPAASTTPKKRGRGKKVDNDADAAAASSPVDGTVLPALPASPGDDAGDDDNDGAEDTPKAKKQRKAPIDEEEEEEEEEGGDAAPTTPKKPRARKAAAATPKKAAADGGGGGGGGVPETPTPKKRGRPSKKEKEEKAAAEAAEVAEAAKVAGEMAAKEEGKAGEAVAGAEKTVEGAEDVKEEASGAEADVESDGEPGITVTTSIVGDPVDSF